MFLVNILFSLYLFYFLELYQKILFIFINCIYIYLLINYKDIKKKINKPYTFYFILNIIVDTIIYTTTIFICCIENIYNLPYNYLFLKYKKKVYFYILQKSINMISNKKEVNMISNSKVFKNKKEMNIFLNLILEDAILENALEEVAEIEKNN